MMFDSPASDRSSSEALGPFVMTSDPTLRVMLVDDEPAVRRRVMIVLSRRSDMEVVAQAGDGVQALEMVDRYRPDVLIMDVEMPRMGGIDATRRIKKRYPRMRVIGYSMFEETDTAKQMLEAGAEAYRVKTGPIEELIAVVLNRHRDGVTSADLNPDGSRLERPVTDVTDHA